MNEFNYKNFEGKITYNKIDYEYLDCDNAQFIESMMEAKSNKPNSKRSRTNYHYFMLDVT